MDLWMCFLIGGFFSEVLGVLAPIAGAAVGAFAGPVAGTAVGALLSGGAAPTTAVGTGAQLAALRGVDPVLGTNVAQSLAAIGTTPGVACAPTTGGLRKRTIVQTICPATGKVFKQEVFAGGVAIRASDVAAAKRVFRQVAKLSGRMPRKTVKESAVKQLTDRVVKNALERAGDDPGCPK